jgi:cytochrome P450
MFSQFCRATRDDGSHMSDGEIVDHMIFLMMAAHDTITSSVTSMIWLLAKHPEWQEKVRAECFSIAPAGSAIAPDQLDAFELTEMAFKEALRMIPPVPSLPRRALRDFEFGGYRIPAGASVGISPATVHKMADYWDEPEKFDPLRFTPENSKGRHKYAWVPFGGGGAYVPWTALCLYADEAVHASSADAGAGRGGRRLCAGMAGLADPETQGRAPGPDGSALGSTLLL